MCVMQDDVNIFGCMPHADLCTEYRIRHAGGFVHGDMPAPLACLNHLALA